MTTDSLLLNRRVPVTGSFDVVVCGGGPAGLAAAIASAREGLRVALVERGAQAGGMGTSGLVSHWLGGRTRETTHWAVGGLFKRFCEETAAAGISVIPRGGDFAAVKYTPYGAFKRLMHGIPYDPFEMAPYLDSQLKQAGVTVLFQTAVVDALRDGSRVTHLILSGKDGLNALAARLVIDATGDADVASFCGCACKKGAEGDGMLSPVSVMFHLDGVDEAALMDYILTEDDPRCRKLIARLRDEGEDLFNYAIMIFVKMTRPGQFMVNGRSFPDTDGTDAASRTRALIEDRRRIAQTVKLFRRRFPGLGRASVRAVASDLGVRETRRIDGERLMTVRDVIDARTFPDTIGLTPYGWDLGNRKGEQPMHGVTKPDIVPIPFGIMVPRGIDNLLCPGRAVSVERDVLGPMRVMAPVMAMGEAAGLAAAQASERACAFRDIDAGRLRAGLLKQGAILELPADIMSNRIVPADY